MTSYFQPLNIYVKNICKYIFKQADSRNKKTQQKIFFKNSLYFTDSRNKKTQQKIFF